jgi:YD repeat-containing protein
MTPRSKSRSTRLQAVAAVGLTLLALGAAAYASETISYKYDARGRLIQVNHSGTVNNNVVSNYSYDKADNRTNVTTNGATH